MQLLREISLLTALSLISISVFAGGGDVCDWADEDGVLKLKPKHADRLEEVCACENVRVLILKKTPLLKLPECLAEMQNLRSLDLTKAALQRFPDVIFRMYSLEHLSLAHTKIEYLPDEAADLINLKSIDLRGTGVEVLPDGFDFVKTVDMRLIMLSKKEQDELRARFPRTEIYLSSPCHCH